MRVTVIVGVVNVVLGLLVLREPARGGLERRHVETTLLKEDLKYLLGNRTYVVNTLAMTAMTFCTGALRLWMPTLLYRGLKVKYPDVDHYNVGSVFGLMSVVSGVLGVLELI